MSENNPTPYDEAEKMMPKRFYEVSYKAHLGIMLASNVTFQVLNTYFLHQDSIPAHITTTAIYAASALADRLSTMRAMNINNLAEDEGAVSGFGESNVIIDDINTAKDFLKSKRAFAIDTIGLTVAAIYPGLAVGLAIGKFQATANTLRATKRINLARSINNTS